MAIKTKAQLQADTAALPAPITRAALITVLDDMIDSYEDIIQEYTTVQRDLLTPFEGQKIYNTTSNRLEYYSASQWTPMSQKETVAIDCSATPNYPEALVGDQYIVSVAGKIGGASGLDVYVGDIIYAIDENAGGTQAGVGASWAICHSQSASDNPTFYAEISLSSAQILDLNATPITLVAAPGAGKVIVPLTYVVSYTYVSAAYAANVDLRARYTTGGFNSIYTLSAVASSNQITTPQSLTSVIANEPIQAFVGTGNPTTGDGTIKIGVYYKIHTL